MCVSYLSLFMSGCLLTCAFPHKPRFSSLRSQPVVAQLGNLMMVFSRMTVSMGSEASVLTEAWN